MTSSLLMVVTGALGLACGLVFTTVRSRRLLRVRLAEAKGRADQSVQGAKREAAAHKTASERAAREKALTAQDKADQVQKRVHASLSSDRERIAVQSAKEKRAWHDLEDRLEEVSDREKLAKEQRNRAKALHKDAERTLECVRSTLEEASGVLRDEAVSQLTARWRQEVEAEASQALREIEQGAQDASYAREANNLMHIAVSRYQNHFLTVRNISNIAVVPNVAELLIANNGRLLGQLSETANIQLHMSETGDSVRLEGLDGVGREVARRALKALASKPKALDHAKTNPQEWLQSIRSQLDSEILGLGKKAFQALGLPRAEREIVILVGKLNFRTSYTQNQWLHAVEASFLAGMMAGELGLEVPLARRATLLHDIGKALTHEIDGPHAAIGAEIAARCGESDIVVNGIASHHGDVPPSSPYSFLVAAADAMSGARPGARREQTDGYSTRLEDLERLGSRYKGVTNCYAVHGGRELRVYVEEDQVSELAAVEMSTAIAEQISEEMTFPGQVKVTVIRSSESVSLAQ